MATTWITGAERLGDGSIGGAMDKPNAPARVVWHTTESGDGDASFKSVADYLIKIDAEPHILYDPSTDRIGQFGSLSESARALKNDGDTRTNRVGKACIQIEVLARAGKPFTDYWKPGPNFRKLMAAIRSWGVPDVFPMGDLAEKYGDTDAKRTRDVWLTKGGHYGHCNIPGNDHWDPGAIDKAALFAAAPVSTGTGGSGSTSPSSSTYTVKAGDTLSSIGEKTGVAWKTIASLNGLKSPYTIKAGQVLKLKASGTTTTPTKVIPAFPGSSYFRPGAKNSYVTQLGKQLVKKGYGEFYKEGPGPQWTAVDRAAVKAFQKAQGWTGSDADGYPGPQTWKKLFS
ncbi:peptidoglycan-binding protein [Streptomyces sp. NPDC048281]|uniref:peptidoglycan-binding protein n=1 Tax=Streptomyces sp. NPDC048281 TaxID=3154715 RepID=UPI003418780A